MQIRIQTICFVFVSTMDKIQILSDKTQIHIYYRTEKGDQKGVEWEPIKISPKSEKLGICPKIDLMTFSSSNHEICIRRNTDHMVIVDSLTLGMMLESTVEKISNKSRANQSCKSQRKAGTSRIETGTSGIPNPKLPVLGRVWKNSETIVNDIQKIMRFGSKVLQAIMSIPKRSPQKDHFVKTGTSGFQNRSLLFSWVQVDQKQNGKLNQMISKISKIVTRASPNHDESLSQRSLQKD